MSSLPDDLPTRLKFIQDRIAAAAARSGRKPDAVTLIGVAKTVAVDQIRGALAAGLTDVGENRVQEAERAIAAVGRAAAQWHLIGHLQRNKSGHALEWFDRIHTLDSVELGLTLSRKAMDQGRAMPALVQVNVSGETSKHGVEPAGLVEMLRQLEGRPGLEIDGLMSIGAPVERPEAARREFARLRELRDEAERALGRRMPHLSMGMSDDYEVAVEEGSTFVRLGAALFGARS